MEISTMFKGKLFSLMLLIILLCGVKAQAQIVINEVQLSNSTAKIDEDSSYSDWIELYNVGNSSVNLQGYQISDRSNDLAKFIFPSYTLASHAHVIVFATGDDRPAVGAHWETAVKPNDTWKYRNNTTAPASADTGWRNVSFNDAAWLSGTGGIGYGDGDDGTTVAATASIYMRKTFTISDLSKISDAIFHMDFDDGFVAYLNGRELIREFVGNPGLVPAYNDLAKSSHEATMYTGGKADSFYFSHDNIKYYLQTGTNVLSVEAHNQTATGADLSSNPWLHFYIKDGSAIYGALPTWFPPYITGYFHANFKLTHTGETIYLSNSSSAIIDTIATGFVEIDNSIARNPDGAGNWCLTETPTPSSVNVVANCVSVYATMPTFSVNGGFYPSSQTVALNTTWPGGTIRFTLDGSVPTSSSSLYSSALTVAATTTVRARVFSATSLPSPSATNTYFINLTCSLPVYSLNTNPSNLFDFNTGIFEDGPGYTSSSPHWGANYWFDWEKPVSVEYFDLQKNRIFKVNAAIKISGGWSRTHDMKSVEVMLSDKFGTAEVSYPLLPDKPFITNWSDWVLHNTGNDEAECHMRDAVMERVLNGTYVDHINFEPCLVYINGQNWGVYYTRENDDNHLPNSEYGVSNDDMDFLKESYFYKSIEVKRGTDSAFWAMYAYATQTSPSDVSYLPTMNTLMDMQNMADYFIAETYYPNGDFMGSQNNNIKLWRQRKAGAKFKYLCYDLDFGLGYSGSVTRDMLTTALNPTRQSYNSDIFDAATKNPAYKNYFINRYADLINTIFLPSSLNGTVTYFANKIKNDMGKQWNKWGGDSANWVNNLNAVTTFINARPANARNIVQSVFSLTSQVTLTLNVSPAGAGVIQISTITPGPLPWSGVYFNGNPVTVTAIPNPGYTFDHWHSNVVITTNNYNQSVNYNYTASDAITAYFNGSPAPTQITISEINYHSDSLLDAGDWVELHNYGTAAVDISNWRLRDQRDNHYFSIPLGTVLNAGAYLVLVGDSVKFKQQHPSVTNWIGELDFSFSNSSDDVRLFDRNDVLYLSSNYFSNLPWPVLADGQGYTLELLSQTGDLNDPANWFNGCIGGSPGFAYVMPVATATSSGGTTMCDGDSLLLNANTGTGNTYQWQKSHANISGATAQSFYVTQAGAYNVVVFNSGCSAVSDSITITVNPQSPQPTTADVSHCGAGVVILNATSSDPVEWYDAPIGGNLLQTGATYNTPVISTTTIYYVRAAGVCPSACVPVTASIISQNANPTVTDGYNCGAGAVTLLAIAGDTVFWYDTPGGNLLATGNSYTTSVISSTTIYYAQSSTDCPSAYVPVTANITNQNPEPTVTDGNSCGAGAVTLQATGTDTVFWYDAPGGNLLGWGNTFITPVISSTTIYYAQTSTDCSSSFIPVNANIISQNSDPVVADGNLCGAGAVTLQATGADTIFWYDAPGGNLLGWGNTFITPVISSTTIYYAQTSTDCASNFISVNANIFSPNSDPLITDGYLCGAGVVTLMATSADTIFWYDAPGGNLLGWGDTFITPVISSTTIYYAQTSTDCPSAFVPVTANITNQNPDPVATDGNACGTNMVTLEAIGSDTIFWYDAPGGNLLGFGITFITPVISSTTVYYAIVSTDCPSNFIPVVANITAIANDPVVITASNCGEGNLTLQATSNDTIFWYDAPGGNLLGSGYSFITSLLTQTTTYYAQASTDCPSSFIPVDAIINPITSAPLLTDTFLCGGGTIDLLAIDTASIRWFDLSSGGTLLVTGANYTTPYLVFSTTYWVEAGDYCPSARVPVTVDVYSLPPVNLGNDTAIATGNTIVLDAGGGFVTYVWSTGATTQTISTDTAGVYFVTVTDNNGCTATDTILVDIIDGVEQFYFDRGLLLYPNPVSQTLNISINELKYDNNVLQLVDITGRLVWSEVVNRTLHYFHQIDVSSYAKGMYLLNVNTNTVSNQYKIIVE